MRLLLLSTLLTGAALAAGLTPSDLRTLRSVSDVRFSPDGKRIAYVVSNNDTDGRPYSQLWVMTLATGQSVRLAQGRESSSEPEWSPDSSRIAYSGKLNGKSGLIVASPDGSGPRLIAELDGTNSPLPSTGKRIAWAPDGNRIAYVTALPGPETADATGDPVVITRYLYKPDADEGNTRFNDNKPVEVSDVMRVDDQFTLCRESQLSLIRFLAQCSLQRRQNLHTPRAERVDEIGVHRVLIDVNLNQVH